MRRRDFLQGTMALTVAFTAPFQTSLKRGRLDEAAALVQKFVRAGRLSAAVLHVRQDSHTFHRAFGQAKTPDTIFLLASITKPMTAVGMMVLVDRGELTLSDPVHKFIPEFTGGDRELITIKHLLTHTSGLPDQLPENIELRRRFAPLEEFVDRTIKVPLLFKPGARVEYQSMGLLLAAEVAERITTTPFRRFLDETVFQPLGMTRTALGLGRFQIKDTMLSQADEADNLYGGGAEDTSGWNWNSQYWRDLGAPWGGAHSTGPDLAKLLQYFLDPDDRVLEKATAAAMRVNQNEGLDRPWGIGFELNAPPDGFGRACSPRAFGHSGATGTLAWADPETRLSCVILTTWPARVSRDILINPVSDLVSESAV
jgi:CubicO group peptidase (beta-lactamase class C family)